MAVCQAEARTVPQLSDIDGNLVTCGKDGLVRTWTQEGRLVKTFATHDTAVRRIVKIGTFAITVGSSDGRLKVWDWEKEGEPEWLFDLLEKPAYMVSLATTANGKLAVASWDDRESWEVKIAPQRIQAWDLDTIQQLASQHKAKPALH
jgi:WD40 repeat protein